MGKAQKGKDENMKKMKRFFALFLAMAMVLGMSMTTFAASVPTENDKKAVKIENFGNDAEGNPITVTMTAYQIIDASYETGKGFKGYVWANATALGDKAGTKVTFTGGTGSAGTVQKDSVPVGLDSTLIAELAAGNKAGLKSVEFNQNGTTELEVGTWMVLVNTSSDVTKVYNPMIVSVYYSVGGSDNTMATGSVSATDSWGIAANGAWMKSSDIDDNSKKEVTGITNFETGDELRTGKVGDVVDFSLEATIPSYSAEYTNPTFNFIDTLVNGLKYTGNEPVVTVGGVDIKDAKVGDVAAYTTTWDVDAETFKVVFAPEYILSLAGRTEAERKAVVTYQAEITSDAVQQVGKNEFTIEYTHNDGTVDETEEPKTERVYTVGLNGSIKKVENVNGIETLLDGATFTLYGANADGTMDEAAVIDTWVTGQEKENENDPATGSIVFNGLDYDKTYYLKETAAPEGYSLNDAVYKVTFSNWDATNPDAPKYKVNFESAAITDGTASAEVTYGTDLSVPVTTIINTQMSSLPSTGGIGTTIFTVGGCAIMILAAGMFFVSRRRAAK